MAVQIIRGAEVNRPTPGPITSTVLDHATVVDKADFGLRNNEGLWPSYNCLDTLVPTALCPDPLTEAVFKEFSVAGWVPGFEFAVYGAVQCSTVGLDQADQKAEIKRVFSASESRGVEQALRTNRFVATDGSDPVQWPAPIEVAPGVFPIATALALLEGYAAINYAGTPTLHLPRSVALLAFGSGLLYHDGGKFYTQTGAKVAAGGGYDAQGGTVGEWDLYATGEVYVERSDEILVQSIVLPGDGSGTGSGENGLADNTVVALAERAFRIGVDCFVAKITAGAPLVVGGGGGGAALVDNGDGTWSEA